MGTCPRRAFSIVVIYRKKENISKSIMIKTALLLFLLELAATNNVPIQKEIVGPGDEVDNIIHPTPECRKSGEPCAKWPIRPKCCPGLGCVKLIEPITPIGPEELSQSLDTPTVCLKF